MVLERGRDSKLGVLAPRLEGAAVLRRGKRKVPTLVGVALNPPPKKNPPSPLGGGPGGEGGWWHG